VTNSANWSLTSGGAGSAGIPGLGDNVIFNASSDSGAGFTVTVGSRAACHNLTISGLDQAMILAGSAVLSIGGSVSFPASNFTTSYTGEFDFLAITTGKTITSNGVSFACAVTFDGVGGGWILQDAFTTTGTTTLNNGSMGLGSYTYTSRIFASSGTATRSIAFGTGQISITGNATTVWSCATLTNFTYSGTPTVNFTYSGSSGTRTIVNGSTGGTETNAVDFNITAGSDTWTTTGVVIVRNVNFTGFSGNASFFGTGFLSTLRSV
jgi:hypothetical protein